MTKNIDSKKIELIEEITSISSEKELDALVKFVRMSRLNSNDGNRIFRGVRKTISVESLKESQNYKGIDRSEFDELVKELDVKESIENLLEMLD